MSRVSTRSHLETTQTKNIKKQLCNIKESKPARHHKELPQQNMTATILSCNKEEPAPLTIYKSFIHSMELSQGLQYLCKTLHILISYWWFNKISSFTCCSKPHLSSVQWLYDIYIASIFCHQYLMISICHNSSTCLLFASNHSMQIIHFTITGTS